MAETKNRVLIVDDTPENLRVLGDILTQDGHEVRVAINGLQGFEIARSTGVDLILLDVMMPDMNGYEVCTRLKADPATREIPIIFLTALDSTDDQAKGLGLGAVDYITKPFKVELVRTRIANQLALHNARVTLKRHNEHLDQLVAERARDLAEAHRRLQNLDAAKYDFLQLIYRKLWGTEDSFIPLAAQAWSLTDPAHPRRGPLLDKYEEAQKDLFDTLRNALLMTGSGQPAGTELATFDTLWPAIRSQVEAWAQPRGVTFSPAAEAKTPAARLFGERDLLVQALGTLAQAATLLALPGTVVGVRAEGFPGQFVLDWSGPGPEDPDLGDDLFHPGRGIHPSSLGQTLGIDLPLAVRILTVLGGSVDWTSEAGRWAVRVTLAAQSK